MFDPVIEIILDARAAHQQRRGIDGDAHLNQYVLHFRFMAACPPRHNGGLFASKWLTILTQRRQSAQTHR